MSDSDMTVAAYRPGLGRLVKDHLTQYRDSAGREGHIIDTTPFKNPRFTPTLLLQRADGRPARSIGYPSLMDCSAANGC
jgi:hypothetical protein